MSTPQKSNKKSVKQKRWKPSATSEVKKLASAESDWNLGGGSIASLPRTRGKKPAAAAMPKLPPMPLNSCLPCSDEDDNNTGISSLTDNESTGTATSKGQHPPARVIIEANPVVEMLRKYLQKCPKCNARLTVTFPTTCIASSCKLVCTNEVGCDWAKVAAPSLANAPLGDDAGSALIKRNTDYEANILFVLSFIACGDGPTEAGRFLGLLGLPNNTTMKSRSFGNIERELSPVLQSYTDEIILQNIRNEVKATFGDSVDDNNNKLCDLWLKKELPKEQWPKVDGCADMGWQQKGSGRRRNSKSGHAFVIGMRTRLVIGKEVCSKGCGYCKHWYTRNAIDVEPPEHQCFVNHVGSSGSMEPVAVLNMHKRLCDEHQVIVHRFVCDDDSSIKAKLKWSNADHVTNANTTSAPKIINSKGNLVPRPDHGRVPRHMPEPNFVADPNHRRKTLVGELFALEGLPKTSPEEQLKKNPKRQPKKWNLTMSKMDCRRLSKNFAFMARTLQEKDTDDAILNAGRAVLEHHFDNHQCCGDWCRRKVEKLTPGSDNKNKFYRCKMKDKDLCEKLQSIFARFITLEALKEVAHNMDTCANESLNNTISWLAPKNKVYCGSNSLQNRISIAVGITALGTMVYYAGLFQRLGMTMNANTQHYLQVTDKLRSMRLAKTKTKEFKKKRKADEYERLKKETQEAITARQKRDGVYEPGIGMSGGCGDDVPEPKKKKAVDKSKFCPTCKEYGHCRTTSRKCRFYVPPANRKKKADTKDAIVSIADELEQLDSMPLQAADDDSDAFFSATSEYLDDYEDEVQEQAACNNII